MEIKARISRREQIIKRGRKRAGGERCSCLDKCPVIIDRGDGLAEYPPKIGEVCRKCGKKFKGIPGVTQMLVIITGGAQGAGDGRERMATV